MDQCRLMLSGLRGSEKRCQRGHAQSETLLPEQVGRKNENEKEGETEDEEMFTDHHRHSRKKLILHIALGTWMIISVCCVFYIVLTLTREDNKPLHVFKVPDVSKDTNNITPPFTDMKLQLIIPSFTPHFPQLLEMLHSMACLITDIHTIDIAIVVSSISEVQQLTGLLAAPQAELCTSSFLSYNVSRQAAITAYPPKIAIYNLYSFLPDTIKKQTTAKETGNLVGKYGKYKYQSMKKLAAAAYLDYDYAMLLDSEGLVIRPVAFKEMVADWAKGPVIWKELAQPGSPRRHEWIANINEACARTLGRRMENFGLGVSYWEGYTWILEKEIVMDMVNSPSRIDPKTDFFSRLLAAQYDIFEIAMYKMHIVARKMEQSSKASTLYTKYQVLDMEEALNDYGLGQAYTRIPAHDPVIAQEFPYMILEEPQQDLLVSFMKEYKVFFLYFHPRYVTLIAPWVLQSFMKKAPLAMTVSGATGMRERVIPEGNGGWNMTYA
ncbi:hypothetical protein VTL71DRAFT_4808 [Oculimacula yallundae]|uniref:Uncharacterized protein n=1 Tax=Oculimacula yallundae TaxID=86028 RepID=A0ABR4C336_9HELO